jgi:hypothetical protein
MLAVPRSWDERRHPLPSLGRAHVRGPLFGLSVLSKVKPPTGEPCAGDPHARFGGEGVRPKSDFLTSIDYQVMLDSGELGRVKLRLTARSREIAVAH